MKFYKIVNPLGHHGLVYKEGVNVDPRPFNPSGSCEGGGIYFSREDILAFLNCGTELYEVEPIGEVYEDTSNKTKKWKAHSVNLTYVGKIKDNIKMLIDLIGQNIDINTNRCLRWAARNNHLDLVKYLVERGADISVENNRALQWAAENGHLEVVKYLVEHSTDTHIWDESPIERSVENGHLEVVKYLVEQSGDKDIEIDYLLQCAADNGDLEMVKYFVEQGADIHADQCCALKCAAEYGYLEVVDYLKSKM